MSRSARIAVLTLHYGFNEGAILQAYALTRLLEKSMGSASAEIIDQRYPAKMGMYGPADDDRKVALQTAIDRWLPLSDMSFRSNNREEVLRYAGSRYDAIVVGSDVVWDLKYVRHLRSILPKGIWPRQRAPFFPAFPNVYWPDRSVEIPKITYAASIGTLEWKDVPWRHRRKMSKLLMDFAAISVRDERTLEFLEWLSPDLAERAVMVPDPTLGLDLLDESRVEILKKKLSVHGVDFERPLCGVICGAHEPLAKVTSWLRERGYQIVGITTPNQYSDVQLFDKAFHPLDWAILFQLMDVCVVERMHGSIFCIKNQVPFIALDRYETEQHNVSKTRSLLRRFGLDKFCVSKTQTSAHELLDRVSELERGVIEWGPIREELANCQSEARHFLQQAASHIC